MAQGEDMGDNEIDLLEAKSAIEGEKLGIVDRIVGRIISRKFFVFLTVHVLLRAISTFAPVSCPILQKI